jgi:hypothetical protein
MAYLSRDQMLQQDQALRTYQSRADDAFSTWGIRAPAPVLSDDPRYGEQYRRELAYLAKKRLPEDHNLRRFQVKHCPRDVFEVIEPEIFAACKQTGLSNDSAPPGQMRMVQTIDPQNGLKINNFYGKRSFVEDFTRHGRRVVSFLTPNGFVDASGRGLR